MNKLRVGVLRGGVSPEYHVSLKTGGHVLRNLPSKYQGIDIVITKDGTWLHRGAPTLPYEIGNHVDVVFNALHGHFGEDGEVQKVLEEHGIPYTGSEVLPSSLGMNKVLSKKYFQEVGINVPYGISVKEGEEDGGAEIAFEKISPPWIVKPAGAGSSIGVQLIFSRDKLKKAIREALHYGGLVLVEGLVRGREATCCVVESDNGGLHTLPPIEIRKQKHKVIFDYESKYENSATEICPGDFSLEEKLLIEGIASRAHEVLGLRHYSRSDMIVRHSGGVVLLEVNTLPGLTRESLFMKALDAVDSTFPEFLEHVISLAVK